MSYTYKLRIVFLILILFYGILIVPFSTYMKQKPIEEKLGYLPSINVLRYASADHKELIAASLVMKVIMYYGGIVEKQQSNVIFEPPDYIRMSGILHGSVKLDPYNMDAYYFAQSFLTWEVKQYQLANELLEYGMKYRSWDWYLPFFAGFNSAYFLKDYKKAAEYYKRAGELSGSVLYSSLAGRYMQESGQTDLAIAYLSAMEKSERNLAFKKNYAIRLQAFQEVRRIELARDSYLQSGGKLPLTVDMLLRTGLLSSPPADPYGGQFYIESDGKVATTSRFAFAGSGKHNSKKEELIK